MCATLPFLLPIGCSLSSRPDGASVRACGASDQVCACCKLVGRVAGSLAGTAGIGSSVNDSVLLIGLLGALDGGRIGSYRRTRACGKAVGIDSSTGEKVAGCSSNNAGSIFGGISKGTLLIVLKGWLCCNCGALSCLCMSGADGGPPSDIVLFVLANAFLMGFCSGLFFSSGLGSILVGSKSGGPGVTSRIANP